MIDILKLIALLAGVVLTCLFIATVNVAQRHGPTQWGTLTILAYSAIATATVAVLSALFAYMGYCEGERNRA